MFPIKGIPGDGFSWRTESHGTWGLRKEIVVVVVVVFTGLLSASESSTLKAQHIRSKRRALSSDPCHPWEMPLTYISIILLYFFQPDFLFPLKKLKVETWGDRLVLRWHEQLGGKSPKHWGTIHNKNTSVLFLSLREGFFKFHHSLLISHLLMLLCAPHRVSSHPEWRITKPRRTLTLKALKSKYPGKKQQNSCGDPGWGPWGEAVSPCVWAWLQRLLHAS